MKHTEGKLVISSSTLICTEDARLVANCMPISAVPELSIDMIEAVANAHRLVATWNACEGIETEDLEGYGNLQELLESKNQGAIRLQAQLDQSEKVKGELLEACKLAYFAHQNDSGLSHLGCSELKQAIQRAEEGGNDGE